MIKLDYTVKVYAGESGDNANIGLVGGVCTWSTADSTLGVLSSDWASTIRRRVDASLGGNEQKYDYITINIHKSAGVETALNNSGLSLIGSMIEVIEVGEQVSEILFRGVIESTPENGNNVEIKVSHLSNFYQTQLTTRVGDSYSALVFGDSVITKLRYVAGATDENTAIGNDLIPAFKVYTQDEDSIEMISVYDETIVSRQDIIDFSGFSGSKRYFIASGENDLALFTGSSIFSVTDDGKTYWGARFGILPLNAKDETGTPFLPTDSVCTLNVTTKDKYYIPYGSIVDYDSLQYESNGKFYSFPSYIDSIEYFPDRIEILDADNRGVSYVAPTSTPRYGVTYPVGGYRYIEGGIWTNADSCNVTSYSGEELYSDRTTSSSSLAYFNASSSQYYTVSQVHTVNMKFSRESIPDSLYLTGRLYYTKNKPSGGSSRVLMSLRVNTISNTYTIIGDPFYQGAGFVLDNKFPNSVGKDEDNIKYRWDNSVGLLGNSIDVFKAVDGLGNIIQDYEKVAGFSVDIEFNCFSFDGSALEGSFLSKVFFTVEREIGTSNLYVNTSGRVDDAGIEITNTADAYKSVLELQNYSFNGIDKPSEGWGLGYPSGDLSGIIDPAIAPRSIHMQYSTESVNSRDVKYDLLKYTSGIGYIDRFGREAWADVLNMYVSGGVLFNKFKMQGSPEVENIDPTRVYPEIGVTYSAGTISVGNVEQDTYSPNYVSGVEDKTLWLAGNVLYNRYKMKNEFPKNLGDIGGIKNLSDAVEYMKNMYSIMGVIFGTESVILKSRHTVSFTTSAEYIHNTGLDLCSPIQFSYPNITTTPWTGMITGISKSIKNGTVDITAECVGDTIAESRAITITETGTTAYNIVETGTTNHNIVEVF